MLATTNHLQSNFSCAMSYPFITVVSKLLRLRCASCVCTFEQGLNAEKHYLQVSICNYLPSVDLRKACFD